MPEIRRFSARNLLSFPVRLVGFLALVVLVGGVYPSWTGQFLLAQNSKSDNIVIFRIDQKTGRLTATGQVLEVGSPVCVKFLKEDSK